ncbi:MAG: glucose-6-phosphate isomerase [Candidatus Omnitrophica bacterium]|nr:glucose-6-phosphate isomerase [Candidatus Omnitrophota bacterium]
MSDSISYDTKYLGAFVTNKDIENILPELETAHNYLTRKNGPGKDFLGWTDLPTSTGRAMLLDMVKTASRLRKKADIIIVVGIGGSYLGAKAAIEMLTPEFGEKKVFFAGFNICDEYLDGLLRMAKGKEIAVNVISKSGTTTEPAIAFRMIFDLMKKKYSRKELAGRIVCTTDNKRGALKAMADANGYKCYVIPDDVGGRFSVLSPVGLFPAAAAGIDISEMIKGAQKCRKELSSPDINKNQCYKYAAVRNILYRKGKRIEVLSNFDNKFHFVSEWWKQLFGESEGKASKGIFPASCDFSADLHSMGQFLQDGSRNIFETFLVDCEDRDMCVIPKEKSDTDELNYLAGKSLSFVNRKAYMATSEAHFEGGVPNSSIMIPAKTAFYLGQLFYFFQTAVAISGYISGVNPFDQPGVEAYKKKMFKLLGKPGA